jgi:septal ring factor EnvC (AmiA/AmiB activator)
MKEVNDKIQQQETAHDGLTDTMKKELGAIEALMMQGRQYDSEVAKLGQTLAETAKNQASLTVVQRESAVALAEHIEKVGQLSDGERAMVQISVQAQLAAKQTSTAQLEVAKSADGTLGSISNMTDAMKTANAAQGDVVNSAGEVTGHIEMLGNKMTEASDKTKPVATSLSDVATKMKESGVSAAELQSRLDELIAKMNATKAAADGMGKSIHNASKAGTSDYSANQVEGGQEVPNSSPAVQ